jgi:hypothetical protein
VATPALSALNLPGVAAFPVAPAAGDTLRLTSTGRAYTFNGTIWVGATPVFDGGGVVTDAKIWRGTTTTDANGDWAVDLSSAGFTSAPDVFPTGRLNTATVTDMVWGSTLRTVTATAAAGTLIRGVVLTLLGATLRRAGAGATVHVLAIGS